MKKYKFELTDVMFKNMKLGNPNEYVEFLYMIGNKENTYLQNVSWSEDRDLLFDVLSFKDNEQINIYFEYNYDYGLIQIEDYTESEYSREIVEDMIDLLNIK